MVPVFRNVPWKPFFPKKKCPSSGNNTSISITSGTRGRGNPRNRSYHSCFCTQQPQKKMSSTQVKYPQLVSSQPYRRTRGPETSIRKLAVAILVQALRDLLTPSRSGQENRKNWEKWQQDALHWFFSEEKTPGSFYWVCDILNIGSWRILEVLRSYQRYDREQLTGLMSKWSELQIRSTSFAGN